MPNRSDFLTHWTGRDIDQVKGPGWDLSQRSGYIDRLRTTISDGLWMMIPPERLTGFNASWFKYEAPMTCFTETRLSRAADHASKYGSLGFCFSRQFVLGRRGGPVHYVPSDANDIVVGNVQALFNKLAGTPELKFLALNAAFIKAMSSSSAPGSLDLLEEFEWRILHTELVENAGHLVATGLAAPKYRIPFTADDLELLVVPDEETLRMAWGDTFIRPFLEKRPVPILTVERCAHF